MAQDKDKKTLNVPHLRFPGFTDEWKSTTIDMLAKVVGGGTPDTSVSAYWNGDIQWFTPSEVGKSKYVNCSLRKITEEGLKNSSAKLLPPLTILLSSRATVGECSLALHECTTNQGFQSLIAHGCDIDFLYYLIQTKKRELIRKSCGSTFLEISSSEIRKIKTNIPTENEQRKIANLLSLIDERIATQNKIIEDLKKLKSAIMAIIFGTSNVTRNQWREVKLGSICERLSRRNSNNESNLILTIAAQHGLVSQTDFFNKSVASTDLSNYFLLKKGDFAYNKSYSGEYSWGAVKRLDLYPQGVLSPLYICFRPIEGIVDSDFFSYLFESKCWYREVSEICVEGARNHGLLNVSVVDFFNMKVHLPNLSEQKRIAEMMCAFSDKIEFSCRLITLFNAQKTYLLSKMFI